jgi:hypothetical protein
MIQNVPLFILAGAKANETDNVSRMVFIFKCLSFDFTGYILVGRLNLLRERQFYIRKRYPAFYFRSNSLKKISAFITANPLAL